MILSNLILNYIFQRRVRPFRPRWPTLASYRLNRIARRRNEVVQRRDEEIRRVVCIGFFKIEEFLALRIFNYFEDF